MNEQSLAVASASSLCLFPWSSQIAEPLIISLSGSCNGSVAASPDFVFITTSPSEIQFFDPRDPELSKLVEANPSSSSDTPIKALLCRSNTGLLFVRGSKIYCRTMDSSRIRHITRNPKGTIHRMAMNKSRSTLATISNSPSNALHTYNIDTKEWAELFLPSSVVSPLVSVEFSPKSSHMLFVLSENSLCIYDVKKSSDPQRAVSLSTFTCEHICLVPTALAAVVIAAKGGRILLIDRGPKARPISVRSINQEITALAFSIDTNPSLLVGTNNGEVLSIPYQQLLNEVVPSTTFLWTVPKSSPVLSITPVKSGLGADGPRVSPSLSAASSVLSTTTTKETMDSTQSTTIKTLHATRIHVKEDDSGDANRAYEAIVDSLNREGRPLYSDPVDATSVGRVASKGQLSDTRLSLRRCATNTPAQPLASGTDEGDPFTGLGSGVWSSSVPANTSISPTNNKMARRALKTAVVIREQHRVGANLAVDHGISSSADLLPMSSYGNGKSSDHSPVRAVLRRRADRREKQPSHDGGTASNNGTEMLYVTENTYQAAQQAPLASQSASRSNAPSLHPENSASQDPAKSPRRPPSAIADAASIRSSSPRSYTPKGTPPRALQGSLLSRNAAQLNNSQPHPVDIYPITTTVVSPPLVVGSGFQIHHSAADKAGCDPENVESEAIETRVQSHLQGNTPPGSPPSRHLLPGSPVRAAISYGRKDGHNDRREGARGKSVGDVEDPRSRSDSLPRSKHKNKTQARGTTQDQDFRRDRNQQQQREKAEARSEVDPSWIPNNEPNVLTAVEELRAETRGAIIGLHTDLIETSRSQKKEMKSLMEIYVGDQLRALQRENSRLRAENKALRGR